MKKWIFILIGLLFLTGCRSAPVEKAPQYRVVSQITVTTAHGEQDFFTQRKMIRLLDYLRSLDPYVPAPEDPSAIEGELTAITLNRSDGSHITYWQKGDRYLMKEGDLWRRIDPEAGRRLKLLLAVMPED